MILGTLMHMLFQYAIQNKINDKQGLNKVLLELLHQKKIISQIYEVNKDEEFILKEASVYLNSIEKWLNDNVLDELKVGKENNNMAEKQNRAHRNFHVVDVCDIEESIWSTKYGIKGKLDLTLQIKMKQCLVKNLSLLNKSTNASAKDSHLTENHIIPVELKSGRTTFSVEHEGQLMLYSLLNKEKSELTKKSDFGLLLYLKDINMKFIKINHNSLKGLLQLRNDLVHCISKNKLSSVKNDERFCSKCPMLTVCSLFNTKKLEYELEAGVDANQQEQDIDLYSDSIIHLNEMHRNYFFKWYKMLELEFGNFTQFESGDDVWWKTKKELESNGNSIFGLRLVEDSTNELERKETAKSNQIVISENYLFEFQREGISVESNLKENDMILLSSVTLNLIGIAQGFIKSINHNKSTFHLTLDKDIQAYLKSNISNHSKSTNTQLQINKHLFRIDKLNHRSSITLNYTNLSKLMIPNERCERLRSFIIDKRMPEFETSLSKQSILKTKNYFKKLNTSQQAAILKSLMAKDYLLIKGYPGTGKTTTIASLISVLIKLEKKVLFTSFTNSAVDNLLLKLIKEEVS